MPTAYAPPEVSPAMATVRAVFDALHRILICLDEEFRIVYVSPALAGLIGENAASLTGEPIQRLFGQDLFRRGGALRTGLENGALLENWSASIRAAGGDTRVVSCTAAPFSVEPGIGYVIVMQPVETAALATSDAEVIRQALEQNRWQRDATAKALGISRTTLWRKMREAGLSPRA